MTEMDDLEPCPFCGARLQRQQTSSGHWYEHMGETGDCYATGSIVFDENIPAWNRRASLSPAGVMEEQVEVVEAAAKRIFEHWQFTQPTPAIPIDGVPAWVEGGNSLMQYKARAFARAALEAALEAVAKAQQGEEGK